MVIILSICCLAMNVIRKEDFLVFWSKISFDKYIVSKTDTGTVTMDIFYPE